MASPYTRYSGQRVPPLPPGYIEGYARGGAGWGAGFAGVGKGIGEAIAKYQENAEQMAFEDQSFKDLSPYLEKILSEGGSPSGDSSWLGEHGDKISKALDSHSKGGLAQKKAIRADMMFLLKRYDIDKGQKLAEQQAEALRDHREETLSLSREQLAIGKEKILDEQQRSRNINEAIKVYQAMTDVNPGMALDAALTSVKSPDGIKFIQDFHEKISKGGKDKENAQALSKALEIMAAPPPDIPAFVPPGAREKMQAQAKKLKTSKARAAIKGTTPDIVKYFEETVIGQEGLVPGAVKDIGIEGVLLVATTQGSYQVLFTDGSKKAVSENIKNSLDKIFGPDSEFKAWTEDPINVSDIGKATELRHKRNQATAKQQVHSHAMIERAAGEIDEMEADLADLKIKRDRASTDDAKTYWGDQIKPLEAKLASKRARYNQMTSGDTTSTGAPGREGARSVRRFNPATRMYE